MLEILKRDWILFRQKFIYLIPIISMGLILIYPKADEGYFVIGVPVVFIISVLLFAQDDKDKGILQLISMPFDRRTIARGRFLSAWIFIGSGIVYLIVLGLLLGLFYNDALQSFLRHLNIKMLFIYLWFISALTLLTFPIMYAFLGKGLQVLVMIGLGLNILLGVFFFIQAQSNGSDIFAILETFVQTVRDYHTGIGSYLLSLLGFIAVNIINLKICEWIFMRKEF